MLIAFWDTNPSQEEYNYGCFAGFQGGLSTQACADVGFEAPASHQRALLIPGPCCVPPRPLLLAGLQPRPFAVPCTASRIG